MQQTENIEEIHLNDQSIKNNDTPIDTNEGAYCGTETKWIGTDFDQLWIEKMRGKIGDYQGVKLKLCELCSDLAVERIMTTI